jgi:hypothetical protein
LLYRTFVIENAVLDQATGEMGVMAIQFRDIKEADRKKVAEDIAVEEEMMKQQGINYKKNIFPTDYFDNYRIQIEIVSDSVIRASMAGMQSKFLEKMDTIAKLFPQIFVMNQREYFEEFSRAFGENPGNKLKKLDQLEAKAAEEQAAMGPGEPKPGQGEPGAPETANQPDNNAKAPVPAPAAQ